MELEFLQRIESIERLIAKVEGAGDPNLRATVRELLQIVMELHGAGLERMLELIGEGGGGLVDRLGRDELVGSLLVLYGIHPATLETRVRQGLDKARSRLRPHDGDVELLEIQDGAVRVRLRASGHGCGLKEIVEQSIYQTAPDVAALFIESPDNKQGFVPITMLQPDLMWGQGFGPAAGLPAGVPGDES